MIKKGILAAAALVSMACSFSGTLGLMSMSGSFQAGPTQVA